MVCPLTLTLETACDRVVTNFLLYECIREILVACHKVFDDAIHLNSELPLFLFLFGCEFDLAVFAEERNCLWVVITALFAVFFCPCKSFLVLFLVVNAFFHTAKDLNFINGLNAHTEVLFHHILIDDGTGDTHTLGTDLEVGFAAHSSNSNSSTTKAEKFLFYIFRNLVNLIYVLNFVAINTECRKAFLCMTSENSSKINCARTLCAVEAPNTFDCLRIHIHCLRTVAPARSYGQCDRNTLLAELVCTSCSLRYTTDTCICHNNFYRLTVGVEKVLLEELFRCVSHCPNLRLKGFTKHHRTTTTINDRADTNYRIISDISVLCHNNHPFCQ